MEDWKREVKERAKWEFENTGLPGQSEVFLERKQVTQKVPKTGEALDRALWERKKKSYRG